MLDMAMHRDPDAVDPAPPHNICGRRHRRLAASFWKARQALSAPAPFPASAQRPRADSTRCISELSRSLK